MPAILDTFGNAEAEFKREAVMTQQPSLYPSNVEMLTEMDMRAGGAVTD